MTITGEQLRAARAMLRLEQSQLAEAAGLSVESIKRAEGYVGSATGRHETVSTVKATLERLGVKFFDKPGAGVYLVPASWDANFPRAAWVAAVSSERTDLGYWDWVAEQKQKDSEA